MLFPCSTMHRDFLSERPEWLHVRDVATSPEINEDKRMVATQDLALVVVYLSLIPTNE